MQRGVILLVLSLWAVLTAGKIFVLDIDTIPFVPLEAASSMLGGITDCTKSTDKASIVSLKITPDPPQKGQNLTVTSDINFKEEITGGTVTVVVKYLGFKVLDKTEDLCSLLGKVGLKCPIPAGDQKATEVEPLPSSIPPGHYTGSIKANDQNGNEIVCLNLDLHF